MPLKKMIETAASLFGDYHVITNMQVDMENKCAMISVSIFKDKAAYDSNEPKISGDWTYNWINDDFPFTGAEHEDKYAIAYAKLKQVEPFFVDAELV